MKKIAMTVLYVSAFLFVFSAALSVKAATYTSFDVSLGRNSSNAAEVFKLQQFLYDKGYLSVQPTGAFYSLTLYAVASFQKDNGIDATGYFGPITRAAANAKLAMGNGGSGQAQLVPTTVTIQSAGTDTTGTAAVLLSNQKIVTWRTVGYPSSIGVNINLLRKVSDSPKVLVLVRRLATDTPNDGSEIWVPQAGETGDNIYVEVTCSSTFQFRAGCQMSGDPVKVK